MPCHKIFSFMISAVFHYTGQRIAVNMHICRTHKNAYLYTLVVKIFYIKDFFNGYHFAISGSDYLCFIYCIGAFWYSEKRNNKKERRNGLKKNGKRSKG